MATRWLVEIFGEMTNAELPFEEWIMLESIARRIERRIRMEHGDVVTLPLDRDEDALTMIAAKANATFLEPAHAGS